MIEGGDCCQLSDHRSLILILVLGCDFFSFRVVYKLDIQIFSLHRLDEGHVKVAGWEIVLEMFQEEDEFMTGESD